MSEQELNSYRFLSGEEPTDEMLYAVMKEVAEDASKKQKKANIQFELSTQEEWEKLKNAYISLVKKVILDKQ